MMSLVEVTIQFFLCGDVQLMLVVDAFSWSQAS